MSHALARAIARFRTDRDRPQPDTATGGRVSAAAFRAGVEQRLRSLERELAELKSRINGLIFLVIGTVITQVTLKLVQG